MSDESEELLMPKHEYDQLKEAYDAAMVERSQLIDKAHQLGEALKKVNAGIHKASDIVEGIAYTRDQKLISNLAFDLLKHHPERLTIRYKGEIVTEIFHEMRTAS